MNFSYLEHHNEFSALYTACREAEEFALTKPDISATSARKAMEFIVKHIYSGIDPYPPYGCTVYDMICDPRFRKQVADSAMLDRIDHIRKTGNAAVHRGNLTVDDAMRALEYLHYVTGEFALNLGLIQHYGMFVKPELNRLREMFGKIHSDNFFINLLPYLRKEGHDKWADILSDVGKKHIVDLSDLPKELDCEDFWNFLKTFDKSIPDEIADLLEMLPLTSATEKEWNKRRLAAPVSTIDKIECFVNAYIADNQNSHTKTYTYYKQILGDKAFAYLWLVHPDYVPESMRDAYVKPEAEQTEDDDYIPMEEALKQMLRYYAAGNSMKRDLLAQTSWCKTYLSLSLPAITSARKSLKESYSAETVHIGDKKYFVLLEWDRTSLMRLRQLTGQFGENIITIDRLADWGFAPAGSGAEKRAQERAKKRRLLEDAEKERMRAEAAMKEAERIAERKEDPEASPREIRTFIQTRLRLTDCFDRLCSSQWCSHHLGFDHPVLISYEEGDYLRRKQLDGNYTYSRIQLEYARKMYFIIRMNTSEFDKFQATLKNLGLCL